MMASNASGSSDASRIKQLPADVLADEFGREKASALGRLGRALEAALAALTEFDAGNLRVNCAHRWSRRQASRCGISLAQRSKPHIVGFWLIVNRCRIERRPAMRAETLQTDVSAIGSLSIFCRFAGQEHEGTWTSDNYRSQWSTAHCLAVCAVANGRRFGIGFGLERHVSAVTASINFHDRFLEFSASSQTRIAHGERLDGHVEGAAASSAAVEHLSGACL